MKNWQQLKNYFSEAGFNWIPGIALALLAVGSGVLLTLTAGWFITATAMAGLGILSLQTYNLFLPSAAIRFLAFSRPLARYAERLCNHRLTFRLVGAARSRFFTGLLKMDKSKLIEFRATDLPHRLTADINQLDQLYLSLMLPWISTALIFTAGTIYFLFALPQIAFLLSGAFLICGIILPLWALNSGLANDQDVLLLKEIQANITDYISGYRELRAGGIVGNKEKQIRSKIDGLALATARRLRSKSSYAALQAFLLQLTIILSLGLLYVYHLPATSGPFLVFILFSVIALAELLQPLTEIFFNQSSAFHAVRRITDIQAEKEQLLPAMHPTVQNGAITIRRLYFSYGKRQIYNGLDVEFELGGIHLIHGANGAGKSTLLDLISGLLTPSGGSIQLNGASKSGRPANGIFAYMEQQLSLFNCSIYDNIAIGKKEASRAEVLSAACQAGLEGLISELPQGIDTETGENSRKVSGGQARMICLARLILRDAPIVLLDEPTAGMDERAIKNFTELVNGWSGQKTVLIISHQKIPGLIVNAHYLLADKMIVRTT